MNGAGLAPRIASTALRGAMRLLCPRGGGRFVILLYHSVRHDADPLARGVMDVATFELQMRTMAAHFNVLPLGEALGCWRAGSLPERTACVTFDDGYADNAEIALPVLESLGLRATFFVATGFLDGDYMWNDIVIESVRRAPGPEVDLQAAGFEVHSIRTMEQRRSLIQEIIAHLKYEPMAEREARAARVREATGVTLPAGPMMRPPQVKRLLERGMEVGAHSANHPILARLEPRVARTEIAASKDQLEALTGRPVRLFAYPNGTPGRDYTREHVSMVRELGFEAAVSTAPGGALPDLDRYQLPRFTPWRTHSGRLVARLVRDCRKKPQLA